MGIIRYGIGEDRINELKNKKKINGMPSGLMKNFGAPRSAMSLFCAVVLQRGHASQGCVVKSRQSDARILSQIS